MRLWPIITAGAVGAAIGVFGPVYAGMTSGLGTSLTTTGTVALVILCPVIYAIRWTLWLVPVLNALFYGGVAFGVAKWHHTTVRRPGK
ncbi:MAG TPA: hypothetical protein VMS18_02625 [Candidatus Binatia bacterium]|nr:hypothetical protein [Candidatus Binatia bacterium]